MPVSANVPGRSIEALTTARTAAALARDARHAVTMQVGAVRVEPGLGARDVRADALDHAPEPPRVVHLDEMRDLVRREIVEHEGRREDQPPRIGQARRWSSTSPSGSTGSRIDTRLIATPSASAARRLAASRSRFDLALEKIGDPARDMRRVAGDAEQALARSPALDPDRAALPAPVHDAVIDAAQRDHGAVRERRRLRQPAEPRRDPAAVLLREFRACLRLPRGGMVSTTSRVTEWMRSV